MTSSERSLVIECVANLPRKRLASRMDWQIACSVCGWYHVLCHLHCAARLVAEIYSSSFHIRSLLTTTCTYALVGPRTVKNQHKHRIFVAINSLKRGRGTWFESLSNKDSVDNSPPPTSLTRLSESSDKPPLFCFDSILLLKTVAKRGGFQDGNFR